MTAPSRSIGSPKTRRTVEASVIPPTRSRSAMASLPAALDIRPALAARTLDSHHGTAWG
jgi:hypothetical protein